MSKVIRYLPEIQGDEQLQVAQIMRDLTEEQATHFSQIYRQRRKDATVTLVTTLVGLFAVGGIQRFYLDQVGIGILYLLTGGLCFIGTIADAVRYKELTARYNLRQAEEVAMLVRGALPGETPTASLGPRQL